VPQERPAIPVRQVQQVRPATTTTTITTTMVRVAILVRRVAILVRRAAILARQVAILVRRVVILVRPVQQARLVRVTHATRVTRTGVVIATRVTCARILCLVRGTASSCTGCAGLVVPISQVASTVGLTSIVA
jgi:hypothetical protein